MLTATCLQSIELDGELPAYDHIGFLAYQVLWSKSGRRKAKQLRATEIGGRRQTVSRLPTYR